jgi:hypothetical protein
MGQELTCRLRYRELTLTGKAYLETDFVLFRGEERLKIPFQDLTSVEAADGILRLRFGDSEAAFELGAAAAKWAAKILHPPSRLDKLGVKPGSSVALVGEFDADFMEELRSREAAIQNGGAPADLLFLAAAGSRDLARIPKLIGRLAPRGVLWVVYPKGVPAIREVEVIQAGRDAGLKDTKVAAFSTKCTALRFSIPAAR